jgi:S-adenosyl methyltransferase
VLLVGVLHCIPDAEDPAGLVRQLLAGLGLVEPGLVQLHHWRPGPAGPEPSYELANYGAVGRKP